jgi:hypothetical protein
MNLAAMPSPEIVPAQPESMIDEDLICSSLEQLILFIVEQIH